MTATNAQVQFGAGGVARVVSHVHLTGSTDIDCFTYEDQAPILTIRDGPVEMTITVSGPGRQVTGDDVTMGRVLAEAAGRYAAELDQLARGEPEPGAGTVGRS